MEVLNDLVLNLKLKFASLSELDSHAEKFEGSHAIGKAKKESRRLEEITISRNQIADEIRGLSKKYIDICAKNYKKS